MSRLPRIVRQTLTIARRDFVATVFTPTFLLFLLSPVFTIGFGLVGGMGARSVTEGSNAKTRVVAIVAPAQQAAMRAADVRLRAVFSRVDQPAMLALEAPGPDPKSQARATFASKRAAEATATLYGDLTNPTVLYGGQGRADARYLAALAEATLRTDPAQAEPLSTATLISIARNVPTDSGHKLAASIAVFGIFFLTLLLAGQAVGTMMEERSNKVIEVLAAAIPLEAVFFGKLIGMFGSALLFVAFWATLVSQIGGILPPRYAAMIGEIGPAVGGPMFYLLFFAYFAMAYLLLGAVFLGAGAQASTPRELQMLSLPITVVQVAMFGLALSATGSPDSTRTWFIELFPLSSPYAMAAHAANKPELWPHAAALAWQALWVVIAITIGARAFRRGVLQSGSGKVGWKSLFGRRKAVDMSVS
ncbi:ABC transporter permease [Sphingomonas sp. HMP6]|uniref:ABC transporter permease n=1 Tax=Sphingomonas sp. HMP6 TaxID=1517551 RepID=UPI0015964F25|nr:ABC transporter permease [Sphingomonas sp. HMP6]BCA60495.1 membrane protein [Sphingomonas sp. HMP6]